MSNQKLQGGNCEPLLDDDGKPRLRPPSFNWRRSQHQLVGYKLNSPNIGEFEEKEEPIEAAVRILKEKFPVLGKSLEEVTESKGVPVQLALVSMLSASSIAAAGSTDVMVPGMGVSPVVTNYLGAAPSGTGKSTVINYFHEPIRKFEQELNRANAAKNIEGNWEIDAWGAERDGLLKSLRRASSRGEDVSSIRAALKQLEKAKPISQKYIPLLVSNVTKEALHQCAADSPSLGCVSAEGGTLLSSQLMKDLAWFNEAWDGRLPDSFRVSTGGIRSPDARLSLCIMAQPEVVDEYLMGKGRKARSLGFLARTFICRVEGRQGQLSRRLESSAENTGALHKRIATLLDEAVLISRGEKERTILRLSPEVEEHFDIYLSAMNECSRQGEKYEHIEAFVSKFPNHLVRVAGIIHRMVSASGDISGSALEAALYICVYFADEYTALVSPENTARYLADLLLADIACFQRVNARFIRKNYFRNFGNSSIRDVCRLNMAIDYLVKTGVIDTVTINNVRYIDLNPKQPINGDEVYWDAMKKPQD